MKLTIGERLKQAREENDLTLGELSIATRVKEKYLQAMEADRFQMLPSPIQQKGFLRAYARVVGLDADSLVQELTAADPDQVVDQPEPSSRTEDSIEEEAPLDIGFGDVIRAQRENLGFSLEQVEDEIFIPERYLIAIEKGDIDQLPSPVQGRGMVKNYAEHLGLDPEPLLNQFANVLQEQLQKRQKSLSQQGKGLKLPMRLRRFFTGSGAAAGLIILLVVSVLIFSVWMVFGGGQAQQLPTETIPGVAEVLLPSATATASLTPTLEPNETIAVEITSSPGVDIQESIQPATPTIAVLAAKNVQLQLIILQRTWVRITADDEVVFEGRLLPGSVEVFEAEERIELLTGNAGGVEVIYNQRDLGVLGLFGEVVSRVYTAEGIATPTTTVTPTPTVTQTPTQTNTPSPTTAEEE